MTSAEFEQTAEPHVGAAFRLACSMLRDPYQAEDVVQEAVFKAWTKIAQLKGGAEEFRPWFLTIVANECRSLLRSRWWRVEKLSEWPDRRAQQGLDAADRMGLWAAVSRLNTGDRTALLLRYGLDLPLNEVALVLGISVGAAKSRLHRAVGRLRPILSEEVQP